MAKVLVDADGPVLTVTIHRPEVKNAVDGETASLLRAAWARFRDDDALAVLVLAGSADAFSSGADLGALATLEPGPHGLDGFLGFTRRTDVAKPIVAAIEGPCLAGGLEIALCADLRVAGEGATFGVTNRAWGVPLVDGGTQRLPRIVGWGRAMDLVLTGRVLDAREAERIGLVTEVVPRGRALARAKEIAAALAALPQAALRADKASMVRGAGRPLEEALRTEAKFGGAALASPELADAPRRFAERRKR